MKKILGVCAVLAMAGCGPSNVSIALEDLEAAYTTAACEQLVRCGTVVSIEECVARIAIDLAPTVHSVEQGRLEYDPARAAACVDAVRDMSCDMFSESWRVGAVSACEGVLRGNVDGGGECFDDQECISENCEAPGCTQACCAGSCGEPGPEPAEIGGPCTGGCAEGLYCSDEGTCAELLALGQECDDLFACAYGLACFGIPATCQVPPGEGDSCSDLVCALAGNYCDDSSLCVALSDQGQGCSEFYGCRFPLECSSAGICEAPPAVGSACIFFCEPGAWCNDNNQCAPLGSAGDPCEADYECDTDYCDDSGLCSQFPVCG
jgi:hypothetical protein